MWSSPGKGKEEMEAENEHDFGPLKSLNRNIVYKVKINFQFITSLHNSSTISCGTELLQVWINPTLLSYLVRRRRGVLDSLKGLP